VDDFRFYLHDPRNAINQNGDAVLFQGAFTPAALKLFFGRQSLIRIGSIGAETLQPILDLVRELYLYAFRTLTIFPLNVRTAPYVVVTVSSHRFSTPLFNGISYVPPTRSSFPFTSHIDVFNRCRSIILMQNKIIRS